MKDQESRGEANGLKIEVFGSLFCPYCSEVKKLLEQRGIDFEYKEVIMILGWKPPLPAFLEMKKRSGGEKTVPQIFINGDHYGDEERLFEDDKAGRLAALAGAQV